jgi:hypothetical protein
MGDGALTLILLIVGLAAAILFAGRWPPKAADIERGLPAQLRGAEIAHAERTFSSHRHGLVARLDRAYRTPYGLQLVELKTRPQNAVHMSDVIELSVQRIALEDETGEPVSDDAWVVVQNSRTGTRRARKVRLMDTSDIAAMRKRYDDVVQGRVGGPAPARSPAQCRQCAHKARCSTKFQDRA